MTTAWRFESIAMTGEAMAEGSEETCEWVISDVSRIMGWTIRLGE